MTRSCGEGECLSNFYCKDILFNIVDSHSFNPKVLTNKFYFLFDHKEGTVAAESSLRTF